MIVGASIDNVFGPVILFGQGGTPVEVVADRIRVSGTAPAGAQNFAIRPDPAQRRAQ